MPSLNQYVAPLYKYIFILLLASIFIYIIVRMVNKRMQSNDSAIPSPPYSDIPSAAQTSQRLSVQSTTGTGISNAKFGANKDNSIRNFCIKASFNTAYTGGFMNIDMVKYVISRGCRFLDFEVYIKDATPIVAYSELVSDPTFSQFTSAPPPISLQGVLTSVISNAFTDTAPNPKDPLFVQLRIRTNLPDGYSNIASIIKSTLADRLYKGVVTPDTQMTDILGKIILIVDNTSSPNYQNTSCGSSTDCVNLSDLVNIDSGTSIVRIYSEKDLSLQAYNPPDPFVYMMRIVLPSRTLYSGISNSNFLYLMKNYGAQIIAQAFYINDNRLSAYEEMFKNYKSAIVPISYIMNYQG
jgi:hypothetical protein